MSTGRINTISIAADFSRCPAGRFPEDGDATGAAFRDDCLAPALRNGRFDKVVVVFDGVAGFGASFLEEAFGGLIREQKLDKTFLDDHLELSTDEPELRDFVKLARRYIDQAAAAQTR